MTPVKEKAKELINDMLFETERNCQPSVAYLVAKQCAIKCCKEMLNHLKMVDDDAGIKYWNEVELEIKNYV